MSLLMDALKKAEQEKKEAAKRLKQTGPNPIVDTGEHKIQTADHLENTGPQDITVSQEMDLSLEPIDAGQTVSPPPDFTDDHPVGENTSEMEITAEGTVTETVTDADASTEMPVQENTQEMSTELPASLDRGMDFSYDNTLEEAVDDEYPSPFIDNDYGFDETLDSVTASQLMEDIGGGLDQPTPVAANTVFEAGRTSKWTLGSRWALLGICAMIILVAGGVIIHYQTTPIARDIPRPVALPDEILAQQAALAALPKPAPPPEPVHSGPVELTGSISAEEVSLSTDETAGVEAPADMTTEVAVAGPPPVSEQAASAGEMPDTSSMEPEPAPMTDESVTAEPVVAMQEEMPVQAEMTQPEFKPILPARPVTPEMIQISRSKYRSPYSDNNQLAYQAYQSGNLAQAESLYKTTLGKAPDNRDALLGLAAIKLRQNDNTAAFLIYRNLLQLNPKDRVARLALMRMQEGRADPVNNETMLKLMLAEKPDSHYLYFSLGSLYASQLKWADAQRAFFEAYTLNNDNPDYALNLAISLDHMGQAKVARDFYARAVELADRNPASFTTSDVLIRIKAIDQAQNS